MSYEIVKSIKIDRTQQKVFMRSCSSNVFPKDFTRGEVRSLSDLLKEKGEKEVVKEILFSYEQGYYQGSHNDYQKSLMLLGEKYKNYISWEEPREIQEKKEEELKEILYKNYMDYLKREKGKYLVKCCLTGFYIYKFYKRSVNMTQNSAIAKEFKSKEDIEYEMFFRRNYNRSDFVVEEIA